METGEEIEGIEEGIFENIKKKIKILERNDYYALIVSIIFLIIISVIIIMGITHGSYSVYNNHETEYLSIIQTNCTLISLSLSNFTCSINDYAAVVNYVCSIKVCFFFYFCFII